MAIGFQGATTLLCSSGGGVSTITFSSGQPGDATVFYLFGGSYNGSTVAPSLGPTSVIP
jgi:hypothetical protein